MKSEEALMLKKIIDVFVVNGVKCDEVSWIEEEL